MEAGHIGILHGPDPLNWSVRRFGDQPADRARVVGPDVLDGDGFSGQVRNPPRHPNGIASRPFFGEVGRRRQLPDLALLPVPPECVPAREEDLVVGVASRRDNDPHFLGILGQFLLNPRPLANQRSNILEHPTCHSL